MIFDVACYLAMAYAGYQLGYRSGFLTARRIVLGTIKEYHQ